MAYIERKTKIWVEKGIISEQDAERINAFEKDKNNSSLQKNLLIISSTIIGLGIITLIACNWKFIPTIIKFIGDFIIWGILILKLKNCESKSRRESFLLSICFFYIFATIGLINQTFHIDFYNIKPLLIIPIITFPFVLPNRFKFINFLWLCCFLSCLIMDISRFNIIRNFFNAILEYITQYYSYFSLIILIGLIIISNFIKRISEKFYDVTLIPNVCVNILNLASIILIFSNSVIFSKRNFLTIIFYTIIGFIYLIVKLLNNEHHKDKINYTLLIISYIFFNFFIYMNISLATLGPTLIIFGILFLFIIKKIKKA